MIKHKEQCGQFQVFKGCIRDRVLILAFEIAFGIDWEHVVVSDYIAVGKVEVFAE
jgi:hypothetical protein